MYERIHREEVTVATDQIILDSSLNGGIVSDVDGDRDEEYLVRFSIVHGEAVARRFLIRPNGSTAGFSGLVSIRGSPASDTQFDSSGLLMVQWAGPRAEGWVKLRAIRNPGGGVNFPRNFWGDVALWTGTTIGDQFKTVCHGVWTPTDSITSLEIVSSETGSTTLTTSIGAGSAIELWRLKR